MRNKVLAAVAAISLAGVGMALLPPADAQSGNTFVVEKVVEGPVPPGSVFVVDVQCVSDDFDSPAEGGNSATIRFDEDGNPLDPNSVSVGFFETCTAEETVTNGAAVTYACNVSIVASPGEGNLVSCVDDQSVHYGDVALATGTITVTNTFEEEPPPPPPDVEPDEDIPDVVDAAPAFTG